MYMVFASYYADCFLVGINAVFLYILFFFSLEIMLNFFIFLRAAIQQLQCVIRRLNLCYSGLVKLYSRHLNNTPSIFQYRYRSCCFLPIGWSSWNWIGFKNRVIGCLLWKNNGFSYHVIGCLLWKNNGFSYHVIGCLLWKNNGFSYHVIGCLLWKNNGFSYHVIGWLLWKNNWIYESCVWLSIVEKQWLFISCDWLTIVEKQLDLRIMWLVVYCGKTMAFHTLGVVGVGVSTLSARPSLPREITLFFFPLSCTFLPKYLARRGLSHGCRAWTLLGNVAKNGENCTELLCSTGSIVQRNVWCNIIVYCMYVSWCMSLVYQIIV